MKNAQEMTLEEFQAYMAQPEEEKEVIFLGMTNGVDEDDMLATFSGVFVL
jgi:hypothetical protein